MSFLPFGFVSFIPYPTLYLPALVSVLVSHLCFFVSFPLSSPLVLVANTISHLHPSSYLHRVPQLPHPPLGPIYNTCLYYIPLVQHPITYQQYRHFQYHQQQPLLHHLYQLQCLKVHNHPTNKYSMHYYAPY